MAYPSSDTPTPLTSNRTDTAGLADYLTETLADGLSSGASGPVRVNEEAAEGVLHVEAADANAFDIEVQYRPNNGDSWATVASFTDGDTNDSNAIYQSVAPVEAGEYRTLFNSGSTAGVTVTLRL